MATMMPFVAVAMPRNFCPRPIISPVTGSCKSLQVACGRGRTCKECDCTK
jgi:hypothetical protein